jgi:hypothetical protein
MIDLLTYRIIVYISTIVWLVPPIRQYKSYFFGYFLFLASADIVVMGHNRDFSLNPIQVYSIVCGLQLITLLTTKFSEKKSLLFITAVSLSCIVSFMFPWEYAPIHLELVSLLILVMIFRRTFLFTARTGKINLFHMVFILYQASLFFKFLFALTNLNLGIPYFLATTSFEIFIGIFFIFYREDSSRLIFSLRKDKNEKLNNA